MKKSLFLLTFLVLFLGTFSSVYANLIGIGGNGTSTTYEPIASYYGYHRSAAIYTSAEIGGSGTITTIAYRASNTTTTAIPVKVYMKMTTATSLAPAATWPTLISGLTPLYNATFSGTSTGSWKTITLTTPFVYTGNNLEILIESNYGGGGTSGPSWYYSTATDLNQYIRKDTTPPSTETGYVTSNRPVIQIDITPLAGYPGMVTTPNPADTSTGIALSGDLAWTFGADTSTYDLWFGPTGSMVKVVDNQAAGATGTYPYAGLSADTEYSWQVISRNASKAVTDGPVWKFRTALPAGLVQIGYGSVTSNNLPINPYYGYSYSQVIYLQSEINVPDQRISKLKYYWNGAAAGTNSASWTVYMGHTTKTAFSSTTDWIPTSAMTQVYSGTVTLPASAGWVEITLGSPFTYDNAQNLVIAVDENTSGDDGSSAKFFGSAVSAARSLLYYDDSTNPDPASPPTTGYNLYSYSAIANIRLQFEDIPAGPLFGISPATWDFVDTDTNTTDSQTFRVTNTGGGSLGIVSVAKTSGDTDYFTITNNTYTAPLGQGAYFDFAVEFTPTEVRDYTVTFTITDDQIKTPHELVVTGNGYTRPAGSTCENPYFVTLPLTGFTGDTALYGNDYSSTWISPNSSYINGDDMVLQFTLAEDSAVSGVLTATAGSWIGMFILNTPPDPTTPAPVLASATSTGTVATLAETILTAGTYYLILSTYPDPQSFQFSLDLNAVALEADPVFTISPASYDYQNVFIGYPVAQNFRITNTGGGTLAIAMADIDIIGDNFDQFDLTPLTEDISLGRNAYKDITVTFDPDTAGAKYASIQIVHNAATKATASVQLTGTAKEAPFFIENFDGETIGQLPTGWTQEGTHWSVYNSNSAGGTAPEMRFYYSPRETGTYRLISPALSSASGALTLSFKHFIDYYDTPATYKLQYSTDGSTWVDIWSVVDPEANVGPATVQVALPPTSGTFYLAWVYEGDSYNTDNWYVDDIGITRDDENVPVEFSSFTATLTADMYVQLTWVTQSETNMNGYYVLRASNDNLVNAETISALIPASNTSETHTYQFKDSELFESGTYYYWLECVEQGSSSYHGPISVTWDNNIVPPAEIPLVTALNAVFPNPFNPIVYIPFSIGKNEGNQAVEVNFHIYNSRGQIVYSKALEPKAPGNYTNFFWDGRDSNGKSCATGVYFIRMTAGKESFLHKAVLVK